MLMECSYEKYVYLNDEIYELDNKCKKGVIMFFFVFVRVYVR